MVLSLVLERARMLTKWLKSPPHNHFHALTVLKLSLHTLVTLS